MQAADGEHTVALTQEGRILLAGDKYIYDFSDWKDVISIATGFHHIIGLKSDGTVYHTGHIAGGLDRVHKWWNIKAVFAGYHTSVGVDSDGCVFITNHEHNRIYLDSSAWNIYYGHKSQADHNSPFEAARKEIISALENILETGIEMSPYLHGKILDSDNARYIEDIREMSRQTWIYRDKIILIKPLADILLQYNTAFTEFYDNFTLDEEKRIYHLSEATYGACAEFLYLMKQLLVDVRSM